MDANHQGVWFNPREIDKPDRECNRVHSRQGTRGTVGLGTQKAITIRSNEWIVVFFFVTVKLREVLKAPDSWKANDEEEYAVRKGEMQI